MKTRQLTPDEIASLRKAFCQRLRLRPKEFLFFLGLSLFLSAPFVVLFVLVSRFGHGDTWMQALYNGGYAIAVGPGVLMLILTVIGIRSFLPGKTGSFSTVCSEIAAGLCRVSNHQVKRVWELVDEGNDNSPDYLAELDTGAAVAIPRSYLIDPFIPRDALELAFLPKSGVSVGIAFSGEPLPIEGRIVTDNVWRNDDLPYLTPIPSKDLPLEVITAFRS